MQATEPQAILTPITEAAIFLTLTVDPGAEPSVRDALSDVSGLKRSVGFRIPEGDLTCVPVSALRSGIGCSACRGRTGCIRFVS
jgi:deferrochelatase/peroxidase EfeB